MVKVFYAKETTIKVDSWQDVSISMDTVLDTAFSSATNVTAQFKDVSITLPSADVEKIDLLGVTDLWQNATIEEKPNQMAEISGTLVLPGDELMESEVFGAGSAAGGTHTTYHAATATRQRVAVLVNLDDGTDEVNYAGGTMYVTEYNPSITGADGHYEVSVTFKCLPAHFFGPQFKD